MSDKRPNILLIFPDQYRGDWTEMNPDVPVKTPNLKNMVEEGVYFKQALTPSPLCAPARACLASGTNYDNCNIINNGQPYPSEQTTFYKLLQDSGYHTMACGKFDLHKPLHKFMKDGRKIFNGIDYFEVWGFSDGMDNGGKHDGVKAYRSGKENMGPYLYYLEQKGLAKTHIRDFALRGLFPAKATPLSDEDYADNYIGRNALKLLDRAPKNKPWFLQVNFNGPHEPFDITKSMKNRWKNVEFPDPYDSSLFSHRKNQGIRQNYAAMLENLDRWIGILSDELKKRGEYENTIIVFSSDHGEMLADHNHMSKTTPYHPSSNVPLFIKGPNIVKGKIIEKGVSIVDLAGTFLDYAGLNIPEFMDANSLRNVLEGKDKGELDGSIALSGLEHWRIAFDGKYKLITGYDENNTRRGGIYRTNSKVPHYDPVVLYDLENDPHELHNIAEEKPEIVKNLMKYIKPTN